MTMIGETLSLRRFGFAIIVIVSCSVSNSYGEYVTLEEHTRAIVKMNFQMLSIFILNYLKMKNEKFNNNKLKPEIPNVTFS